MSLLNYSYSAISLQFLSLIQLAIMCTKASIGLQGGWTAAHCHKSNCTLPRSQGQLNLKDVTAQKPMKSECQVLMLLLPPPFCFWKLHK